MCPKVIHVDGHDRSNGLDGVYRRVNVRRVMVSIRSDCQGPAAVVLELWRVKAERAPD